MAYRGNLPPGSRVEAELTLDETAAGSALVAVAYVANDGSHEDDSAIVVPGGFGICVVTTVDELGRLRVFVDLGREGDRAQLTVRVDGVVQDDEAIEGDTSWAYSLS